MNQLNSIFVKDGKRKSRKTRSGHVSPQAPLIPLNQPGRLRIANLMALLQIAHTTVYKREADRKIPPRDGNDGRPWWHNQTILAFLETGQLIDPLCPAAGTNVPNATSTDDLSITSGTPLPDGETQ